MATSQELEELAGRCFQLQLAAMNDLAVHDLALALALDWCARWGGPPDNPIEMLKMKATFQPEATRLLNILYAMPKPNRDRIAGRLSKLAPAVALRARSKDASHE